jgi:hypothetical protein
MTPKLGSLKNNQRGKAQCQRETVEVVRDV